MILQTFNTRTDFLMQRLANDIYTWDALNNKWYKNSKIIRARGSY